MDANPSSFLHVTLLFLMLFCKRTLSSGWYSNDVVTVVGGSTSSVFFTATVSIYINCYNLCRSVGICKALNYYPSTGVCQLSRDDTPPDISDPQSVHVIFNQLPQQVSILFDMAVVRLSSKRTPDKISPRKYDIYRRF